MSLARGLARQLAHPRGLAGRLLGGVMDIANRTPTRLALDLLAPQDGEHVLDAGCGTGAAMAMLLARARCDVTGIDPSEAMLGKAARLLGPRAQLHRAGMEALPFADGSFDAVIALNVFYFLDEAGDMAGELFRVLRPGGRLVAYVTHRETMEGWPFARAGLHRLFDEVTLAAALGDGGFASSRIDVHCCRVSRSVRGLLVRVVR